MLHAMPVGAARRVNRLILTATFGFSVIALGGLLIRMGYLTVTPAAIAGLIYGASLLLCSLCSYLYNMHESSRHRALLRYFDHCAIFLLIAGTYTPFVIHGVAGPFGIDLLVWVWGLACLGIVLKLVLRGRHDRAFVALYLALGWLMLTAFDSFIAINPATSLVLLAVGGGAYSIGALIYGRGIGNWTDPVWHACVLTGSCTHFFAVLLLSVGPQIT